MSWSLEKESALRELTRHGVLYADALHALSAADDAQVAQVVASVRAIHAATREEDAR